MKLKVRKDKINEMIMSQRIEASKKERENQIFFEPEEVKEEPRKPKEGYLPTITQAPRILL